MSIAFVSPSFFPAVRYGGPTFSSLQLSKMLASFGYSIDLYTTDAGVDSQKNHMPNQLSHFRKIYRSQRSFPEALFFNWKGILNLYKNRKTYDLFFVNGIFHGFYIALIGLALVGQMKIVISVRGSIFPDAIKPGYSFGKYIFLITFIRPFRNLFYFHCCSQKEIDDIAACGIPRSKSFVINNLSFDLKDLDAVLSRVGLEFSRQAKLVYMGRHSWEKGVDRLPEIGRILQDLGVQLVIISQDYEKFMSSDEFKDIEVRSPLYGPEKFSFLANHLGLILPSRSENFGNVVLEALAVGTPVICSSAAGACELLDDQSKGVVIDFDCNDWHSELAEYVTNLLTKTPRVQFDPFGFASRLNELWRQEINRIVDETGR